MNERIRELIEQATTKQDFYPAGCNGYPDYRYEFDKEKFAELIVRECAKFLDENSGSDCTNNVWYPEPEELLKHFGVKE